MPAISVPKKEYCEPQWTGGVDPGDRQLFLLSFVRAPLLNGLFSPFRLAYGWLGVSRY